MARAPPAGCSYNVLRFNVASSDVIDEQARVNVSEEKSERVIWYKERFLGEDEIVEHVVHNPTSTICWTIHRPKRGWYIRIRSRLFPPGAHIPLIPSRRADGALEMVVRTSMPIGSPGYREDRSSISSASSSSAHSYPPTPMASRPPSLTVTSPGSTSSKSNTRPISTEWPLSTQICEFVMQPAARNPEDERPGFGFGFVSRALASLLPSNSNAFTLSRVSTPSLAPPPYTSTPNLALGMGEDSEADIDDIPTLGAASTVTLPPTSTVMASKPSLQPLCPPLLSFIDTTPIYSLGSRTGTIEIAKAEERLVGIDTSFWIAVALTYLDFLKERESYLAAAND